MSFKIKVRNNESGKTVIYHAQSVKNMIKCENDGQMFYNNDKIISITDLSLEPHFFSLISYIFRGKISISDILILVNGLEDFSLKMINFLSNLVKNFFLFIRFVLNTTQTNPFFKLKIQIFISLLKTQFKTMLQEFKNEENILEELKSFSKPINNEMSSNDKDLKLSKEKFEEILRIINEKYKLN